MRVCVAPIPRSKFSPAMFRVADALTRHAPPSVTLTPLPQDADLQIVHVIGPDAMILADRYAVIQYCLHAVHQDSTGANVLSNPIEDFKEMWKGSELVWSYYPRMARMVEEIAGRDKAIVNFYLAPLGVDPVFLQALDRDTHSFRRYAVMTSGHVDGPGAEAIVAPTIAALRNGHQAFHLGPSTVMDTSTAVDLGEHMRLWSVSDRLTDPQLSDVYASSHAVAGLRYLEGFEMPAVEGMVHGCRPILFDRPDMTHWYGAERLGFEAAVWVAETKNREVLTDQIDDALSTLSSPLTPAQRSHVASLFDWETIATNFWSRLL